MSAKWAVTANELLSPTQLQVLLLLIQQPLYILLMHGGCLVGVLGLAYYEHVAKYKVLLIKASHIHWFEPATGGQRTQGDKGHRGTRHLSFVESSAKVQNGITIIT